MKALGTISRVSQLLLLLSSLISATDDDIAVSYPDDDVRNKNVIQIMADRIPASFEKNGIVYHIIEPNCEHLQCNNITYDFGSRWLDVASGEEDNFSIDENEGATPSGTSRVSLAKRAAVPPELSAIRSMNSKELDNGDAEGTKPWSALEVPIHEVMQKYLEHKQAESGVTYPPGYYQAIRGTNVAVAKHVFVMVAMTGQLSQNLLEEHFLPELMAPFSIHYLISGALLYGVTRNLFAVAGDFRFVKDLSREKDFQKIWRGVQENSSWISSMLSTMENVFDADSRLAELRNSLILQGALLHMKYHARLGMGVDPGIGPEDQELSYQEGFDWSEMTRAEAESVSNLMASSEYDIETIGEVLGEAFADHFRRFGDDRWLRHFRRAVFQLGAGLEYASTALEKVLRSEKIKWKSPSPNDYKLRDRVPAKLRSQRPSGLSGPPTLLHVDGGDDDDKVINGDESEIEPEKPKPNVARPGGGTSRNPISWFRRFGRGRADVSNDPESQQGNERNVNEDEGGAPRQSSNRRSGLDFRTRLKAGYHPWRWSGYNVYSPIID
ncbi:MAG: hypothetical protein M1831_002303 [Alyxoria varia]|nr:MAG: hypothetical protein M1831_002303 [Alyxoria varia]